MKIVTEKNSCVVGGMVMKKLKFVPAVVTALTLATASAALADCSPGFLANLACGAGIINKETANTLDGFHAQIGNSLDRGGAFVAQYYGVPVSGSCMTPVGVFIVPWGAIGTPCSANGFGGVRAQ